jgi:protein involved in polysaccharide export with SLBB domain
MKKAWVFVVIGFILVLAGCSTGPAAIGGASTEDDGPVTGLYRLRPMDPITISMLGIPEEKQLETVIDEKGNLSLPYVDEPVKASGLTTSELEQKIQKVYTDGQIYRNITINILTSAKSYYMEGEVARPQEYPLTRRITLLQAIAAASGYTDFANRKNVTVTRNGQVIKVNAKDLEKHPERDIPIEAGDRIKVHRSLF